MTVVSDTTALTTLLKVERVDLLEKLFGGVLIPPTVDRELSPWKTQLNQRKVAKVQSRKGMRCLRPSPAE